MKVVSYRYSSAEDLLDIVHRQMLKAGWTVNYFGLMKSGDHRLGRQLLVAKNGCFFGLRAFGLFNPYSENYSYFTTFEQQGIAVNVCEGFNPDAAYAAQPGFRQAPRCYVETSFEGRCWITYSGDFFMISTEYDQNRFSHVLLGKLPTFVANSGGNFVSSTHVYNLNLLYPLFYNNANCFLVRINHNQWSGWDSGARTLSSLSYPVISGVPTYHPLNMTYGNLGTATRGKLLNCDIPGLIPVNFLTLYAGNYSPFAEIPGLFVVPLDYVDSSKELVIGQKRLMVLPFSRKGSWVEGSQGILNWGVAVLIDE